MKMTTQFILLVYTAIFAIGCAPIIDEEEPRVEPADSETERVVAIEGSTSEAGGAIAAAFDQFVDEMTQTSQIPGTAVALIYEDEVVLLKGYGFRDVENRLPATPDTLFHIASTQKSMTAMLVATLVDEGVVDWDTPLVEVAPDFTLGTGGDTISLRHLLSMSSGIPDTAEDDFYEEGYEESADSMWPLLAATDPLAAPGEQFSYSNISSSMAGYAAVLALNPDATDLDTTYGELLFERVIRPIGMDTAAFSIDDARKSPNYGKSYILDGDDLVEAEPEDFAGDTMTPSGVLKVSAADMALYIQTQLNQGIAPNGKQVVSAENMTEMWEPQITDDDDEWYALGWGGTEYDGVTLVYHEGSFDNYESVIGFVPELALGFVVLTNASDVAEDLIADTPWFLLDTALEMR